ncbi:MAG: hypothetical protein JSW00_14145 [Thermoplasmata archaeon]|nr:MAG: hypothetical protein JSW00_14145 [Thermoplasmata archaeon]
MPNCRICRERIDLSQTGIRAHKCGECKKIVCRNHYDFTRDICYECAGLPISSGGLAFSFIRKSSKSSQSDRQKG